MDTEETKKFIENKLPEKCFKHFLRVADTAAKLAEVCDGDKNEAELADILHDYCKCDDLGRVYQVVCQHDLGSNLSSYGSEVLHGPACVALMKANYGIKDEEILLVIKYHATDHKEITRTEKLVFIVDYIGPGRKTPGIEEIRDMVYDQSSLDRTIYKIPRRTALFPINKDITVYNSTIEYLDYYNYSDQKIKDG